MTKDASVNANPQLNDNKLSLTILRAIVGYIFLTAGLGKLFGWSSYGGWALNYTFFEQVGIPFPNAMFILVGLLETLGGMSLILGLFVRILAIPLIIIMVVAITVVHRQVGYQFPVLLYAACWVLIECGSGKYSLDSQINKK